MARRLVRLPTILVLLRTYVAALLLLFFAGDLLLDAFPPVHTAQDFPTGPAVSASNSGAENPADDFPGCGIPGHACALSHHHHFPAVLSTNIFTILVATLHVVKSEIVPRMGHSPASNYPIRAPPFA